jgi:NADPH:quinone reductase-like Zn-dependent oxidoreductase
LLRIKWLSSQPNARKRAVFYDIAQRRAQQPDWFQRDLSSLFTLLQNERIAPRVQRVYALEEAVEAHRLLEAGDVEGRLVLDLTSPFDG